MDKLIYWAPLAGAFLVTRGFNESTQTTYYRVVFWLLAWAIIVAVQWTLLSMRGQTLGKLALGLRVVDADKDGNPGFMRAVVLRGFVPALIVVVPIFGKLFLLADPLAIFGEERRCLHDRIADTKVVEN